MVKSVKDKWNEVIFEKKYFFLFLKLTHFEKLIFIKNNLCLMV